MRWLKVFESSSVVEKIIFFIISHIALGHVVQSSEIFSKT